MKKIDNEKKIVEFLSKNYRLGKIQSIIQIQSKNINNINYKICTQKGQFVLRKFNDGSPIKKIEKICKILAICNKNKLKIQAPIIRKDHNYVDSSKKMFLTKYYSGSLFNGKNSEIKDLAVNLGSLHKRLKLIPIKFNYKTNDHNYKILTPKEIKYVKKQLNKKVKGKFDVLVTQEIDFLTRITNEHQKFLKLVKNYKYKKQLIHFDLHPQNVIFQKNKVSVIIDFNSMRKGLTIQDIAFTSFRFAEKSSRNINKIKNKMNLFLNSYLQENNIDEFQLNHFNNFLINILLTRASYILKRKYFVDEDIWTFEFKNYIKYLKIAIKIN